MHVNVRDFARRCVDVTPQKASQGLTESPIEKLKQS